VTYYLLQPGEGSDRNKLLTAPACGNPCRDVLGDTPPWREGDHADQCVMKRDIANPEDVHDPMPFTAISRRGARGEKPLGRGDGVGIRDSERIRITDRLLLLYPGFPVIFPWIS
jgi:hypothetical protein